MSCTDRESPKPAPKPVLFPSGHLQLCEITLISCWRSTHKHRSLQGVGSAGQNSGGATHGRKWKMVGAHPDRDQELTAAKFRALQNQPLSNLQENSGSGWAHSTFPALLKPVEGGGKEMGAAEALSASPNSPWKEISSQANHRTGWSPLCTHMDSWNGLKCLQVRRSIQHYTCHKSK